MKYTQTHTRQHHTMPKKKEKRLLIVWNMIPKSLELLIAKWKADKKKPRKTHQQQSIQLFLANPFCWCPSKRDAINKLSFLIASLSLFLSQTHTHSLSLYLCHTFKVFPLTRLMRSRPLTTEEDAEAWRVKRSAKKNPQKKSWIRNVCM